MKLDSYEEIIKDLSIELRNYLISQGASSHLAEDVIQDVFVKILELDLILPPDKLRPYMYQMVKNKYIDQYRRDKRLENLLEKYLVPELQRPPDDIDPREERLEKAMNQLSSENRELLNMKYINHQSIEDISEQLKIPTSAVKMRLYRLRHKVKKIMGDKINE
ncbi:RNA polymerase sigma factor [Xylocopilactobacillus apis]|uniref:DNA-directed RNA polymerase sigma-70 factor n=1 Tax=Xylocopilactobacillus apis TaxID=2932183 RepID=A0AAU9DPQ0_9LACO|nr:RNA polymerase sigma factor [Xylocopilactobacillus apis]BDR55503.1 DNA-directed RNA polymerase sigma-70 factor [Xylocopilactobacillus apis]